MEKTGLMKDTESCIYKTRLQLKVTSWDEDIVFLFPCIDTEG